MAYKYDAYDANGLVKKGDYEALIERMEVKTSANGRNKLSVMFRIRSDVEQSYKNKAMFKDIWSERDNPDVFNRKQINQLLGTQQIKDGTEFQSINDVIKFLENVPLIIHVDIEFDDYHGEDVNTISYFKKTKIVPQTLGDDNVSDNRPTQPVTEGVVGDDDGLPF